MALTWDQIANVREKDRKEIEKIKAYIMKKGKEKFQNQYRYY